MIGDRFHRFGTDISIAGGAAAFVVFPDVIDLKHIREPSASGRRRLAVHYQCTQTMVRNGAGAVNFGSFVLINASNEGLTADAVWLSQSPQIGIVTHLGGAMPTAGQRGWFGMGRAVLNPAGNALNQRYLGVAFVNIPITLSIANSDFTAGKFTCELAHEPDDGGIVYPAGRTIV